MRFLVPDNTQNRQNRIAEMNEQCDDYLKSDAFISLLDILKIQNRSSVDAILSGLKEFDTRRGREVQFADTSNKTLQDNKERLFYIYKDLGLVDVHMPSKKSDHGNGFSDLIVLGGAFEACYRRTEKASNYISKATRRVSGLSAFRPIPSRELDIARRVYSKYVNHPEHTEFEAMSDAFARKFELDHISNETFISSTNLNLISNIREFCSPGDAKYKVYASPSSSVDRRASTLDTYEHFLNDVYDEVLSERDCRLLVITDNRYVTYQIIPLLICIFGSQICDNIQAVDIIGCYGSDDQATKDSYDIAYINDIIATVDWIIKFREAFCRI